MPLETAVRIFSTNAADFYKLGRKGRVEPGRDADVLVLDGDLGLVDVFALGKRLMAGGKLLVRAAGDIAPLTLFWQADRAPSRPYKLFVHLGKLNFQA